MCKTYCENLTENLSHNFVLSLITQYGLKPAILRLLKNVKVAFVISKFVVLYLYTKLLSNITSSTTHFSFSHSHTPLILDTGTVIPGKYVEWLYCTILGPAEEGLHLATRKALKRLYMRILTHSRTLRYSRVTTTAEPGLSTDRAGSRARHHPTTLSLPPLSSNRSHTSLPTQQHFYKQFFFF